MELIDCAVPGAVPGAVCDEDEQEAEEQRPPKKPRMVGRANAPTIYDVDEVEDAVLRLVEGWPVPVDGERRAGSGSGSGHGSGPKKRKARSDTAPADTSVTLGGASSSALTDIKQKRTRVRLVCARSGCAKFARGGAGSTCKAHGGGARCAKHGCKTSARSVLDEDGNRWCHAHGGGYRCAETGCETSARGVLDEDGNRWCIAHSVEAVARREEEARARALLQRILAAPSAGPLPLLQLLDGEALLPRCAYGVTGCYVRMFKHARGRPVPDDASSGAGASASSDGVDALEAASEDDEAEMDDAAPQLVDGAPMLSLEAAPEGDDVASLMRETSADAEEALGLLSRLRRRLLDPGPLGRGLTDELARVEQAMHRVITVEATLAAADAAGTMDAATLDREARAGAESLRACFEGRASTGSTVPAVATPVESAAEEQAGATPTSEAGPCLAQRANVILKCIRHSAYPEKVSKDTRQQACADQSPGDRLLSLGSLQPYDPRSWQPTGPLSMYAQYISWPSSKPLPSQFDDCPGDHVRLEVGDDIVAACAPFEVAIRAHAGRLGMSPEAIERVVTLNMSACVAACGSLEMHPGEGAPDRAQILRVECYGNGVDDKDAAAGKMHVDHADRPLYTDMRLGHLYLQKYGHAGRLSWGLSIRGAGRGHLLVRAVAHGGGDVKPPSMTKWALTVAKALRLSPQAFHEPTCVGDVFTSRLVRLVL